MMKLRVVFAGTPEFSLPSLQTLDHRNFEVAAVVTQPDRPKGRGRKLTAPPVKQFAEKMGLKVLQTERITAELIEKISNLKPDVIVVVAFGLILPSRLLKLPKYGCINVHASLLPRWRGAAPVARSIEAGDKKSGATIMLMNEGLDTGEILSQIECPIEPGDTTGTLQEKIATLGAEELVNTLSSLPKCLQSVLLQDDARATYAKKLSVAESVIDWSLTAEEIVQKVHAFNPWPIARTHHEGMTLRLWQAELFPEDSGQFTPGEIIESTNRGIIVRAGQSAVRILHLQREGRQRMRAQDFLSGYPLPPGSRFQ